jgi:hypothetical protein
MNARMLVCARTGSAGGERRTGESKVARSLGAVAIGLLAISLGLPSTALAGLSIHSFSPADVTLGTRLVIKGDFSELVASGARAKVQGTRIDTPRMVKFQVLAVSRRTIIARVREVPSSKSDPAAGKTWSLRVRSLAQGGGETAQADGTFTTAAPALLALFDPEARPGDVVSLYALDPGQGEGSKRPTVRVGGTKAKVLDLRAGKSPDDDPWRIRFRAPDLRNGFYPVRLQNSLGKSARLAELLIFGGQNGGLVPFLTAAVESLPALEAPLCSASAGGGSLRVTACDGSACARALELEFEPDPTGAWQPAAVSLRELAPLDGSPQLWVAAQASARLVPSPAPELVAGTFVAELQPAGDPSRGTSARGPMSGPRLRMRGYFQAPTPEALAAR